MPWKRFKFWMLLTSLHTLIIIRVNAFVFNRFVEIIIFIIIVFVIDVGVLDDSNHVVVDITIGTFVVNSGINFLVFASKESTFLEGQRSKLRVFYSIIFNQTIINFISTIIIRFVGSVGFTTHLHTRITEALNVFFVVAVSLINFSIIFLHANTFSFINVPGFFET